MSLVMRGYTTERVVQMLKEAQGERNQREFAELIGIAQSNLSEFYRGLRSPSPKILSFLGLESGFIKAERAA